jgi:hypothetical protein
VEIGAFGEYAPGFTSGCPTGASCSESVFRVGAEVILRAGLTPRLSFWGGLGTGYEWLTASLSANGQEAKATLAGWEYLNLQAGLDLELAPFFKLGPFAAFSVGQYGIGSVDVTGLATITLIHSDQSRAHEWLQLGLKGTFDFGP